VIKCSCAQPLLRGCKYLTTPSTGSWKTTLKLQSCLNTTSKTKSLVPFCLVMLLKVCHYASICSYAFTLLLCSKLCCHNSQRPTLGPQLLCFIPHMYLLGMIYVIHIVSNATQTLIYILLVLHTVIPEHEIPFPVYPLLQVHS